MILVMANLVSIYQAFGIWSFILESGTSIKVELYTFFILISSIKYMVTIA